jgi:hypothetical protein
VTIALKRPNVITEIGPGGILHSLCSTIACRLEGGNWGSVYLCIFDGEEEVEGVEIGSYADFGFFREGVTAVVENGKKGSRCPILINHHDSDGEWSPEEAGRLVGELKLVANGFSKMPPVTFNSDWKKQVAASEGLEPRNLLECFFDVDGVPLVARLLDLAEKSDRLRLPIIFQ